MNAELRMMNASNDFGKTFCILHLEFSMTGMEHANEIVESVGAEQLLNNKLVNLRYLHLIYTNAIIK